MSKPYDQNDEPSEDSDPTPPYGIPRPSPKKPIYEEPDQADPNGMPRPHMSGQQFLKHTQARLPGMKGF